MFIGYQIFILHRIFGNIQQNTQRQEQVDTAPRLPAKTCPEKLIIEKGKPTTAYWNGQTLEVADSEQKWVEQNCPGALKNP